MMNKDTKDKENFMTITETAERFDPAILIGKQIESITTTRNKTGVDFVKISFTDSSYIEFYLNADPEVFYVYMEDAQ